VIKLIIYFLTICFIIFQSLLTILVFIFFNLF